VTGRRGVVNASGITSPAYSENRDPTRRCKQIRGREYRTSHFGIVSEAGWSEVAALLDTEAVLRT
jgi:hypothetical protein